MPVTYITAIIAASRMPSGFVTGRQQRRELGVADVAASRLPRALDGLQVDGPLVVLGVHQPETPRLLEHRVQSGECLLTWLGDQPMSSITRPESPSRMEISSAWLRVR
jgi:hypothetical protein